MLEGLYDSTSDQSVAKPLIAEFKVSPRLMSLTVAYLGHSAEPFGVPMYDKTPFYKAEGNLGVAYIQDAPKASMSTLYGSLVAWLHAIEATARAVAPKGRYLTETSPSDPRLSYGGVFSGLIDALTPLFHGLNPISLNVAWKLAKAMQDTVSTKFSQKTGRCNAALDVTIWPAVLELVKHVSQNQVLGSAPERLGAGITGDTTAKSFTPKPNQVQQSPQVQQSNPMQHPRQVRGGNVGGGGGTEQFTKKPTFFNGQMYDTRAGAKRAAAAAGVRLPKVGGPGGNVAAPRTPVAAAAPAWAAPFSPPAYSPGGYGAYTPSAPMPFTAHVPPYAHVPYATPPTAPGMGGYSPYGYQVAPGGYPSVPGGYQSAVAAPPAAAPSGAPAVAGAPVTPGVSLCYDFMKGRCTRGAACKFSHQP